MSNEKVIGERLKLLRKNSKLTQEQMADYLNVDQTYITKIENGSRKLNIELIDKICNLFGCTEDYLLGEIEDHTPLHFAFRSNNIRTEDLQSIAAVNKIAINLKLIDELLKDA